MKDRADKLLLAGFLLTAALTVFCALAWGDIVSLPPPLRHSAFWGYMILFFPAVPIFCLQLLLCRRDPWYLALPLSFLLVVLLILAAAGLLSATGWEGLGFLILLLSTVSAAVGSATSWLTYAVGRRNARK